MKFNWCEKNSESSSYCYNDWMNAARLDRDGSDGVWRLVGLEGVNVQIAGLGRAYMSNSLDTKLL